MKSKLLNFLIIGLILTGCKKEELEPKEENNPAPEMVTLKVEDTPSADAADDNKSSGVYKGTFVGAGSSGSFKLTLETDNIEGTIVVDGVGYKLTSSDISNSNLGATISNASFTDASGIVNLTFSVGADGQNPAVNLTITGNSNIKDAVIAKETSNNQIKIYEGYKYPVDGSGLQCKYHLNVLLNTNNTAFMTMKYTGNSIDLNDNIPSGTCDNESYYSENYQYSTTGSSIRIYQTVQEDPNDPNSIIEDDLLYGNSTLSDTQIYSYENWTDGGVNYSDSLRLIRKL